MRVVAATAKTGFLSSNLYVFWVPEGGRADNNFINCYDNAAPLTNIIPDFPFISYNIAKQHESKEKFNRTYNPAYPASPRRRNGKTARLISAVELPGWQPVNRPGRDSNKTAEERFRRVLNKWRKTW